MDTSDINEINTSHEGLVIHSKISYVLSANGKRTRVGPMLLDNQSLFTFEIQLFPPMMALPSTWRRYGYTAKDVETTVISMRRPDPSHLWALSLALMPWECDLSSLSSGVRPTFSNLFGFLFVSCKTLIQKFIQTQTVDLNENTDSVLCKERPDHKPLLPKVSVPESHFHRLINEIPAKPPTFLQVTRYPYAYRYKDILMVPVEFDQENNLIYMVRIIAEKVYQTIPVLAPVCAATAPVKLVIQEDMFVLLDEACFFTIIEKEGCKRLKTGE